MQEAQIADFSGWNQRAILQRSKAFYVLRIGGFTITTGGGLICMIWGIAGGQTKVAVIAMSLCVLIGLAMGILSIYSRSSCASCGVKLDTYYCSEKREDGTHSGYIHACRHCNAYEVRLNLEFD